MNLYHLAEQTCAHRVPGAFVELGSYVGETATVLGMVLAAYQRSEDLCLFDSFESHFGGNGLNVRATLEQNLYVIGCQRARIVSGRFTDTVPVELPAKIALCHIDCGTGGAHDQHSERVLSLLTHVYPRLVRGGVIVLMDYHDGQHPMARDVNPGVRQACDLFFADKPESVCSLYAGEGAQGFIRKL